MAIVCRYQVENAIAVSIKSDDTVVTQPGLVVGRRWKIAGTVIDEDGGKVFGPVCHGKVQVAVPVEITDGKEDAVFSTVHQPLGCKCAVTVAGEQGDRGGGPVGCQDVELSVPGEVAGTDIVNAETGRGHNLSGQLWRRGEDGSAGTDPERHGVAQLVGNEHVQEAVAVEVGCIDVVGRNTCFQGDWFGEFPAPLTTAQIKPASLGVPAATRSARCIEQIEQTVLVEVCQGDTLGRTLGGKTRHCLETTVSLVAQQQHEFASTADG